MAAAVEREVSEEVKSPQYNLRSFPGLNGEFSLCTTLHTAGGVCELYAVQTTTPSGLGTSGSYW
jgi:hypothetical protein